MTFTGLDVTDTGEQCDIYRAPASLTLSVQNTKLIELKKHIAIIHCGNRLSLLQHKISNALLAHARNDLLIKETHTIHVNELCKLIGYDSKDYKLLKASLKALASIAIEWNLLDKENPNANAIWIASSLISEVSIDGVNCQYSYSKRMRELLYRPEIYARIDMRIQSKFKSSYGLTLYENCIRFQNLPQTPLFDLMTFRKIMGVDDQKYPIFRDLKRRVIDIAIDEVNKYAPITVSLSLKKEKRNVVGLQFLLKRKEFPNTEEICSNKRLDNLPIERASVTQELYLRLINEFSVTKKIAEQIITQYPQEYIEEKIAIVFSAKAFKQGRVQLPGYLISAIRENYQSPKTSQDLLYSHKTQIDTEARLAEERKEEISRRYRQYCDDELNTFFMSISEEKKDMLILEWLEYEKQTHNYKYKSAKNIYSNEGLNNKMVRSWLRIFLQERHSEIFKILSQEEFFKTGSV